VRKGSTADVTVTFCSSDEIMMFFKGKTHTFMLVFEGSQPAIEKLNKMVKKFPKPTAENYARYQKSKL